MVLAPTFEYSSPEISFELIPCGYIEDEFDRNPAEDGGRLARLGAGAARHRAGISHSPGRALGRHFPGAWLRLRPRALARGERALASGTKGRVVAVTSGSN
jgi:hypothetical protein